MSILTLAMHYERLTFHPVLLVSQEEETDRVSTPEESPEESDQEEVIYPTSSNEDMALDPR